MKGSSVSEREYRRLASVASEYRERGYEVKIEPPASDLPEFLQGFQPDLVATGRDESVVVEVKARNELDNEKEVQAIEAAVRDRPGWRFELIIVGPDSDVGPKIPPAQISGRLDEANELQQRGHTVAGLLVLWSATEAVLRSLADSEAVELESSEAGYLVKRLYSLGLIARDQYRTLDEVMRVRHRAAHGYEVAVTREDLEKLASVTRELLKELEPTVA